ncbi:MAG: aldehyde dehydrogenase family protein, partial [Bdellovibrionales bacterium]|nr:aldehyde dehydrogenase family protein [Bdellovibrionales bacterium]
QVEDVRAKVKELQKGAKIVYGNLEKFNVVNADSEKGAFFPPILLLCEGDASSARAHDVEAFGPVSTVIPYSSRSEAISLANRGQGSLVASLFTADNALAKEVALGIAPYHGRLVIINRECAAESTGHGSPLPHLVHGGPGRAGGGEELGGVRGVDLYMQRTALQGSPTTLTLITNQYQKGAKPRHDRVHPFQKYFDELDIGDQLVTHHRTITDADVSNFAGISGDFFYAHMDEIAAAKSPVFDRRVAHGYFVLSAAAGLFVHAAPGPVLANYGLENLRFVEPVYPGDSIYVRFTCKQKTEKEKRDDDMPPHGIVEWDVEVLNQIDTLVATYSILTLVEKRGQFDA